MTQSFRNSLPIKQNGVALIMVILVVALAVTLATSIAKRQSESIRATSAYFDRQQAYYYARGGEEWARQILFRDHEERPNWDGPSDLWMSPELVYEIPEGSIALWIEDQERYVNLNQWSGGASSGMVVDPRLLSVQIGLDPLWIDELIDFTDLDQEPGALGAEDYYYLGLEQPYRTSGQKLAHVSELRLMKSMTPEAFARLSSILVTLPAGALPLNVNTMGIETILLLAPEMNPEAAESVASTRLQQGGFESVQQFLALPEFAGIEISKFPLDVQSSFFKVRIRVEYFEQIFFLASLLFRDSVSGEISVLHRSLNEPFIMPEPLPNEDDS